MPSIEAPQEVNLAEDINVKIREIITGPPSSDYMRRQFQLIFYKIQRDHPGTNINREQLDAFALDWADSKLSEAFSKIARNHEFKTHDRFNGDIANIKLEDVEYFAENGKMPV